jgi:hypothetical protein
MPVARRDRKMHGGASGSRTQGRAQLVCYCRTFFFGGYGDIRAYFVERCLAVDSVARFAGKLENVGSF